MKIKRFFAPDIRQAMRMVKEELGADAVIMSNKSVDGGIEIVAARDFDEQLIQSKVQKNTEEPASSSRSQRLSANYGGAAANNREVKKLDLPDFQAEKNNLHLVSSSRKPGVEVRSEPLLGRSPRLSEDDTVTFSARSQRLSANSSGNRAPINPALAETRPTHAQRSPVAPEYVPASGNRRELEQYVGYAEKLQLRGNQDSTIARSTATSSSARNTMGTAKLNTSSVSSLLTAKSSVAEKNATTVRSAEKNINPSDNLLLELSKELKSLRSVVDSRLSNTSFGGVTPLNPVKMDLLQRLAGMSISRKLSSKIANRFANHADVETAFNQVQELLVKVLPVINDDLLQYGGVAALVGPTGVGKTTTIAKLAAKFTLKHGSRQVALITTDNYRIGAHEQLSTYGRILDIPVRVAANAAELHNLINGFADKRLVLIDTAGMSQRGMKLVEQINTLQQSGQAIKSYLVMSAATEYKAMNEIIKAFQVFEPQASILTKLDEAATVGSAISSIIENNLPLSFIADGQQVPEDMHSPCARTLIAQCVTELDVQSDYNDTNNEVWMAQGYA